MDPGIWDSDGCTTSDSSDLPDLVSSDEDLKPWFPPIDPPRMGYDVLIPKRWCYLRMSVLKRYCHVVKVQLLSPILFGQSHLDERYRNWAAEAELVQYEHCGELQDLDLKTLKIINLFESAHRALLVYALKRPLLMQFIRVVGNLVKCSTLEEAIKVVKQQMIFRDVWKTLTFGNKMQTATVLALTGLHYFNLIKQYSIDHNDLFEQFEDQCFQEEEQAKRFHEHWESDMKKQHYEAAVKSLNEAIRVCAFNHLLYEKRSYCYLQLCQYKKAWSDAKRCIVLRPHSIEGHYLFAGALYGKGWYTHALKANSLAVQVCQWKGLNVKGLIEQRELIQTEQILSSKEKQIGKWERDDISLKESCDSESSAAEEDDEEEGDESSEDDNDVIPTVEAADVWVKNTKDNIHSDREQNKQTLHLDIPFLSLIFKTSSSESENDSLDRLNHGQKSKMSSEGDNSDSESDSSLKQNQRDIAIPCNSVESDNLEKTLSAFVTKTSSFPSADLGQVASSPTDLGKAEPSSCTAPGKAESSSCTAPGKAESSTCTDSGKAESSPTDLGKAESSSCTAPGKAATSPTDPGKAASLPSTYPGIATTSPPTDPGKAASSPSTYPGIATTSPPTDPGKAASSPPTDSGKVVSSPTDPGKAVSSPSADPGKAASSPSADPGKVASSPSTDPGKTASSTSTDFRKDMLSPSVSSVTQRSSYESGLMSEEMDQVSSESKQHMLYIANKVHQEEQNKLDASSEVEERSLKCKLKEASEALMASNFRNAQENYLNALKLIKEKKVYNLTTMEYILIEYACGLSFLGNNLIQDILEAERHFMKILEFKDEDSSHFNCLSYYGLSRVFLKWNRYKEARTTLEKSLTLVESNLVPGLQTWPGTDTVIEETRDGVLEELLNSLLKECLCQPRPDALCHYQFCYTHNKKRDIYRSDPDFKGFVRVHCSYDCHIEYHLYCWKRCKIKELQDKVEKEILGLDCLTPDCMGCIWKVDIFQDSRQKTIESSKLKENKTGQNPATKQSASSFNLKKIARKKEKKHQTPGKLPNMHQEQTDTSNKKTDQSELKDETVGARKKEAKTKKNTGFSNEWMKNDKSGFLEEGTSKLDENSYVDSEMTDYYQWAPKEKMQSSNTNTYSDDGLQDKICSLNLGSYSNKKSKCKTKVSGPSQHKDRDDMLSAEHDLLLYKSQCPPNPRHSALFAEEQTKNHLSEQAQVSLPANSSIKKSLLEPNDFKSFQQFRDVTTNNMMQVGSDDSYSKSQSLKISSVANKNIKTCDAAVITDPIKPFESKERTFLYLYHEKVHLLQNCEKSQKLYVQLCADTQHEIKTFKEKHEQLVINEKKLRDELTTIKVQLEAEKEKLHEKRKYQSQELSTLQEELKSVKNNLERNKKTIHENDTEAQKIKEGREKWLSDKKRLQKNCCKNKENCKESATRLLSAETQIEEWKKYTRLYFLNRLLKEAVENVKFYTAQKTRNVNSPEVIAACDMWEKRMKGIQGQITLVNETGVYSDGASYASNLMPSQYKSEHQKYSASQQRLSPPPVRMKMGKNVGFAGNSDTAEGGWFLPGSRNTGLDAKISLRMEKDCYMSAAWLPSYSRLPTVQPNSAIDQLDHSQSDLELEFRMFAGQKRSFPDPSLQLASGGLEMPDPSTEAKPLIIPNISLATLSTSQVPGNLQNHLFETSGSTAKSFNKHFNHSQSAHAIVKSNKDFQALQNQRPLGGTSFANSSLAEPRSSYHTVMEQLFFKFPTASKDVFHSFINKVKEENCGTLSGLSINDLVRRVSHHVIQGTHLETTYPSSEPFSFVPTSYENSLFPSHSALQPDLSPATPDRFSGLMSASADPSGFESLPLGDLLELEGCFDGL
uniref:uncharacterized protein isoform X2 n=1 Tax=Pristiophorus japonicus TaxID=55135 RepID=UPI00398EFAEC